MEVIADGRRMEVTRKLKGGEQAKAVKGLAWGQ